MLAAQAKAFTEKAREKQIEKETNLEFLKASLEKAIHDSAKTGSVGIHLEVPTDTEKEVINMALDYFIGRGYSAKAVRKPEFVEITIQWA